MSSTDNNSGDSIGQQPIVSVRGTATLEVAPETATLHASVVVRERTRDAAERRLVEISGAIAKVIDAHEPSLRRHSASPVSVSPVIRGRRHDKPQAFEGRRHWSIAVRDFDAVAEMLSGLAVSDAISVDGPSWSLERDSAVYQRARVAAVDDALERARAYAGAFGSRIERLVEIADVGMSTDGVRAFSAPMPRAMMRAATESGGVEEIDLKPVPQEVTGSIEARFTMTAPDLSSPPRG